LQETTARHCDSQVALAILALVMDTKLLKIGEVAEFLGISKFVVRKLIKRAILEGIGFGEKKERCAYVTRRSVDRLIENGGAQ